MLFVLCAFYLQATAVACLERRESVLVSAHTSAGKTAVAEYAIAMGFRDKQRVVYTSPLKVTAPSSLLPCAQATPEIAAHADLCGVRRSGLSGRTFFQR